MSSFEHGILGLWTKFVLQGHSELDLKPPKTSSFLSSSVPCAKFVEMPSKCSWDVHKNGTHMYSQIHNASVHSYCRWNNIVKQIGDFGRGGLVQPGFQMTPAVICIKCEWD